MDCLNKMASAKRLVMIQCPAVTLLVCSLLLPYRVHAANVDDATWLVYDKNYRTHFLLHVDMKTSKTGTAYIGGGNRWAGRRFTGHGGRYGVNLLRGQFNVTAGHVPFMVGSYNESRDEITGNFLDSDGGSVGSFVAVLKGHTYYQMDLFQICGGDKAGILNLGQNAFVCINRGQNQRCDYGGSRYSKTFFAEENCTDELAILEGQQKQESAPKENGAPEQAESPSQADANERQALIAFYESTNGSDWKESEGWLSDKHHCDWHGVECTSAMRVRALVLESNNLSGTLVNSIGDLRYLDYLNLRKNRLEGALPKSLEKLSKLKSLALGDNNLSGVIPESIGYDHPALFIIDLSNNRMSGGIPASLGALELERLYLYKNEFVGGLPDWIPEMSKLKHGWLDNNRLSGPISEKLAERYFKAAVKGARFRLEGNDFDCPHPQQIFEVFAYYGEFCIDGSRAGGYTGELNAKYAGESPLAEVVYVDGKPEGVRRLWHPNGNLYIEDHWSWGKRHGLSKSWHENGQLRMRQSYLIGERHGFRRFWDADGKLTSEKCWIAGEEAELEECDAIDPVTFD